MNIRIDNNFIDLKYVINVSRVLNIQIYKEIEIRIIKCIFCKEINADDKKTLSTDMCSTKYVLRT